MVKGSGKPKTKVRTEAKRPRAQRGLHAGAALPRPVDEEVRKLALAAVSAGLDKKALLPVSSLVQGAYGLREICLSVPSVVSRKGVESHVEIKLWPKEVMGLQNSAKALKETLAKVNV